MSSFVNIDDNNIDYTLYGGKAYGLHLLYQKGFAIPLTVIIPPQDGDAIDKDYVLKILSNFPQGVQLAIRSSAIGEDGAEQSFAGVFETKLNVDSSNIDDVITNIVNVQQSTLSNKVSSYNEVNNIKMGVVIQEMVDPLYAGVAFTKSLSEKGDDVLFIEFVDGLGDKLVSGKETAKKVIVPYENNKLDLSRIDFFSDESKDILACLPPLLNDLEKVNELFDCSMDIEWAVGKNRKVWMLQARPITKDVFVPVKNNNDAGCVVSYGRGTVEGIVYYISSDLSEREREAKINSIPEKSILMLDYSDTEYLPAMKKAIGIISTQGSVLSHAAIVSRELGIPCIVGCKNAEKLFPEGANVKIDPSKGEISSEKYSSIGNKKEMEWGGLFNFDKIKVVTLNDTDILFEKLEDNSLAVHMPEDVPMKFIDDIEKYARINYHKSPKQYKDDKYLWYFENERFNKLPIYSSFVQTGKMVVEEQSVSGIKAYFNCLEKKAKILSDYKHAEHNLVNKFLADESIQALHFAGSLLIAQGYAVTSVYRSISDTLINKKMKFIDFIALDKESMILKTNKKLGKAHVFLKEVECQRNDIFQKLNDNGVMGYGYFEDRNERALAALGDLGLRNLSENRAVDVFYENLNKISNKDNKIINFVIQAKHKDR